MTKNQLIDEISKLIRNYWEVPEEVRLEISELIDRWELEK